MNGFAPMIEGFLAFALTMLALTTGVSSIVGALHHLRRKHARGLRDMVRLLYAREIVTLLDDRLHGHQKKQDDGTAHEPEETLRIAGSDFIVDRTSPGVPALREVLGDAKASIDSAASAPTAARTTAPPLPGRADFIFDMTFMPHPIVVAKLEDDANYWRNTLESAEKLAGTPWYRDMFHVVRVFRYWRTLRYSLHVLKDDEFRERLAASKVGLSLKEKKAWTRVNPPLANWEELAAQLLKRFQTLGGACSETFARHSRGWSIAVGFCLAFFLNIDSLDLLNSYLTDPDLRQQVIAQSNDTPSQAPAPAAGTATALASARAALGKATTRLGDTADDLTITLETFTATLNSEERQRFAQTVQGRLQTVVAQAKEVESGFGELDEDLTETQRTIRGVAQSLTASFPIGWKRFPNCTGESADLRCRGQRPAPQQAGAPASASPAMLAMVPFAGTTLSRWSDILLTTRGADPEAFHQWVIGVLLTGLLLGLGTPFWVHAVSTAFSLRRWDPKKPKAEAEAEAAAARAPAPAVTAGGSKAGAGAPQAT